jgi:hypothetical protein
VARAVRELLAALARDRPVALLLDDVQWADPRPRTSWRSCCTGCLARRVLVAVAMRSGRAPVLEAALGQTGRTDATTLLELGPLPRKAVETLLPRRGRPHAIACTGRAAAIPSSSRSWPGRRPPPRAPRSTPCRACRSPSAPRWRARSGRSPPQGRVLLESAAVAGDPFELELAAAIAELDERATLDALDELLDGRPGAPDEPCAPLSLPPSARPARRLRGRGGRWRLAAHARASEVLAAGAPAPAGVRITPSARDASEISTRSTSSWRPRKK